MSFFIDYFNILSEKIKDVDIGMLNQAAEMIKLTSQNGGKTIIVGNGASASIASHISVDLTKNAKVRAINFNEADLITCFANDFGYERWVEKGIEFYVDKNDVVILISSSGKSPNIVNGALKAKELCLRVITFSGFSENNPLKQIGDINFWINSNAYNIIEMTHNIWLLAIVDKIIGDRQGSVKT